MSLAQQRPFIYKSAGSLYCDDVAVASLAKRFGTPLYVYSAATITKRFQDFTRAFGNTGHTICYSVKANSNLAVLKLLESRGAGFDVVSGGELERVRHVSKAAVKKVVFSGVGKLPEEIDAAIKADILIFNIESASELELVAERAARLKKRARMALRVNPDVFAETHPYISTGLREHKFGVDINIAPALYLRAAKSKYLDVAGVSVHIGSQITSVGPFAQALERVAQLVRTLSTAGHNIRYIDAGGGLGISYQDNQKFDFTKRAREYAAALKESLGDLKVHLLLEPGRSIIGPAGALVTRVLYLKQNGSKRFVVVDAGMNDLIRPSLYQAYHEIVPVKRRSAEPVIAESVIYDVVGPVCESGDFFARDRELSPLREGEWVAILDAGAYGFSISSNYNSRPRSAEVLVEGKNARIIRRRETFKDLVRQEL